MNRWKRAMLVLFILSMFGIQMAIIEINVMWLGFLITALISATQFIGDKK